MKTYTNLAIGVGSKAQKTKNKPQKNKNKAWAFCPVGFIQFGFNSKHCMIPLYHCWENSLSIVRCGSPNKTPPKNLATQFREIKRNQKQWQEQERCVQSGLLSTLRGGSWHTGPCVVPRVKLESIACKQNVHPSTISLELTTVLIFPSCHNLSLYYFSKGSNV